MRREVQPGLSNEGAGVVGVEAKRHDGFMALRHDHRVAQGDVDVGLTGNADMQNCA